MSNLVKIGLVKRQNCKYLLTSFGKVVYSFYMNLEEIDEALDSHWKLKAMDLLEYRDINKSGMPREERIKIKDQLITNQQI